jgi:uncharacterized protein (DUF433 family)
MTLPDFLTQDADGEIRLAGHRIGLYTLARCYREGRSAEEIADEFPSLSLELVRKVLAFCGENQAEVDAYTDQYRADLEKQAAASVPGPGASRMHRMMEKIRQADARHAEDPQWFRLSAIEKLRRLEQEGATEKP